MKKNIFDRMSDSYDKFHLMESHLTIGNDTISISPKVKLFFGWSLFILCCVMGYVIIGKPITKDKEITQAEKEAVLGEDVDVNEEHDTIVPYEKDGNEELNVFIEEYFRAITNCDNLALQDMVTDASEYNDAEALKQKAEFITGYSNITVYTKEGLDEGSYIAFVVANLSITGVNSSPYDIMTLYIVNGARGYLINNGTLSQETKEYIEKVKGDKDIQKIYRSVEKQNNELKENDSSLQEFFDIISRRDVEVDSAAEILSTEEQLETEQLETEQPETEQLETEQPETEQPETTEQQATEQQQEAAQ